ncbi:TIGR01457 family HAD-type hydrolase [Alkalihalophilus marmarensis]|uniref:TIGR01457 family HAD-type hydrolase n=1 Tax=Alkalihalophilus marmarensis TaxID=521377 RepID=UPI002DBDCD72|nr:TIGR01457 family HAD-type hydrolase [Alkalihalophilus marmarensis]MEC2071131.1 TIGR01457 family HAD-type hydrolase [Alkalihalophilus marmarensis]
MKAYKGFLIDLDGTMYRGTEPIPEAIDFVKRIEQMGYPYLFVTNNSTKTPREAAGILQNMGVPATSEHIFTTSMAAAGVIKDLKPNAKVLMVGENGLKQSLLDEGHELVDVDPDYVVMGLDREITYEKLAKAALAVRSGATFIATNGDRALPTEKGLMPGAGSLISVITTSTGVKPTFIGKPEPIMIEQALEKIGVKKEEALMIGDNYDTDILAGINADVDTLMVLTGVSNEEHLKDVDDKPTYVIPSLSEWQFN